jgi:hypothetical protein
MLSPLSLIDGPHYTMVIHFVCEQMHTIHDQFNFNGPIYKYLYKRLLNGFKA